MSEIDTLRSLLNDGFKAVMILRELSEEELRRQRVPISRPGTIVRALPLRHSDGRTLMFYMTDADTIKFAEELVSDLRTVIGIDLCV